VEVKKKSMIRYKIGLALSGGSIKGFAHLGVLQYMDEIGLKPDIIAGTSAGAIMGAFYADGYSPKEIFEIFSNYAEENINFEVIISDKISNFSLDKLEEIITLLAKKELKHIEVIGAILGGLIGVAQYLITLLVK